jgi:hypothetical protein
MFLQAFTGIAILGMLHSSNVFSQNVDLFLKSSFPWWSFFLFILYVISFFPSILDPDNLTVTTAAT